MGEERDSNRVIEGRLFFCAVKPPLKIDLYTGQKAGFISSVCSEGGGSSCCAPMLWARSFGRAMCASIVNCQEDFTARVLTEGHFFRETTVKSFISSSLSLGAAHNTFLFSPGHPTWAVFEWIRKKQSDSEREGKYQDSGDTDPGFSFCRRMSFEATWNFVPPPHPKKGGLIVF